PYPHFVRALAFLGDRDGNGGVGLAAVRSDFVEGEGAPVSALDVLHLTADGTLASIQPVASIYPTPGFSDGDRIPDSLTGNGGMACTDLDRDGLPDLLVCSQSYGLVWALFLDAGLGLREARLLAVGREGVSARIGTSVAALSDVDGDGVD